MCKKILKELLIYLAAALVIWYCYILISDGVKIHDAVSNAVNRCLNVIIPSLFAFMAISEIIAESGLYCKISAPFSPLAKYILKIPKGLFFVFLLGNLAGYPIGIKLLASMVQKGQISKRTAEIMSCCCYCGGPAFYSGAIGLAVYGNTKAGIVVFLSIVISNMLIGIIMGRIFKINEKSENVEIKFSPDMLIDCVISAGKSLFSICVLIVFFSTIMATAEHYHIFENLIQAGLTENETVIIKSVLEITSLSELFGQPYKLLPITAAVCSFGGLCIIIQIIAINKNTFSLKMFLLTRPVCALFSALICCGLSKVMLPSALPCAVQYSNIFVKTDNLIPSICLILMILLLSIKKRLAFSKQM